MTKNNFFRALDGHPSIFMKILHYAVFYASGSVRNFLYSKEIDPMTIHLNDFKFMEKIMFIFVSSIFSLNEIFRRILWVSSQESTSNNSSNTDTPNKKWWCAWISSLEWNRWQKKSKLTLHFHLRERWPSDRVVRVGRGWVRFTRRSEIIWLVSSTNTTP